MSSSAHRLLLLGGRHGDPIPGIIAKYGTPALYLGDNNPLVYSRSGLSQSYLDYKGITPAASSGQTIGMRLDESQGAAIGAEVIVNGVFDADANWVKGIDTGWSIADGFASAANIADADRLTQTSVPFVADKWYKVVYTISGYSSGQLSFRIDKSDLSLLYFGAPYGANGTYTEYFLAAAETSRFVFMRRVANFTSNIDNVTARAVAGNHANQPTAADEPTLIQSGNNWLLRGDGLTKNLLGTLYPAASFFLMGYGEFNAVSDIMAGASVGTGLFRMGTGSDGKARLGIGTTEADISAASIVDVPGTLMIRASGSTYSASWRPGTGGAAETVSGTFAGSIPTTQPIRYLAENDDGTAATPMDGDGFRFIAGQFDPTDAEITAIDTYWRRQLGATP